MDVELIQRIKALSKQDRARWVDTLTPRQAQAVADCWPLFALDHQQMPPGNWRRWVMRAGRGGGKTHAGAKHINEIAEDRSLTKGGDIAIIARTYTDVRQTCIEGSSGILATAKPGFRPKWEPGNALLTWPNGVRGRALSGDKPAGIRGVNCAAAWLDELSHYPDPDKVYWEGLEPALRIGWARAIITTTPLADPFLRALEALDDTVVTRASTWDNPHLPPEVVAVLRARFAGTRRGLQELQGVILEDDERFLWKLGTINEHRISNRPELQRIVVAIDPAGTANATSDSTGIVVVGKDDQGHAYVLHDATMKAAPHVWAGKAVELYKAFRADRIVAETNFGADMVEGTIMAVDESVSFKGVRATRGKVIRAEPVAALYERGRVHHVGVFEDLERQMTEWVPGKPSPDRLDALVWACTELLIDGRDMVGPLDAYESPILQGEAASFGRSMRPWGMVNY